MAKTATPDYQRGLTFEKVWAALMEQRERQEKEARQMKERHEEIDRQMEKTDRQMKRLNKQMGDLHRKFGQIAEHLVAPGIAKRFNELGFHFDSVSPGGHKILDEQGNTKAEVDILLENGDYIVAVEVKTTPVVKDVEHHTRRLEILREHRSRRRDYRKIQGAIAGAIFSREAKDAVIEAGMYVLEQSGDTMKMEIPKDFKPKEW